MANSTFEDPAFALLVEPIGGDAGAANPVQNSALPTVVLSVSSSAGSEAGTTAITVTATASAAVSGVQTVDLAVTGSGITAGDFTLTSPQITIANGATSGSVTFTVLDDALAEPIETATLTISNPTAGIVLGATTQQTIAITSDDVETPTLTVTTTADIVDNTDGLTSLREAIALANATAGTDTITFATGQGQAFQNGGLIRLTQGELVITDAVTINGAGKVTITGDRLDNDITVQDDITNITQTLASNAALFDGIDNDGDGQTDTADTDGEALLDDNSRIFSVAGSSAATTLSGLTLTGGYTTSSYDDGGAIFTNAALTVSGTMINGNGTRGYLANGGGVFGNSTILLTNSTISGNSTRGEFAFGGGMYGRGVMSLINSTVSGNSTQGKNAPGGGILVGGPLSLINSTVSGNSTRGEEANGGGIFSNGGISLTNSLVLGNLAINAADNDFLGGGRVYDGGNVVGGTLRLNDGSTRNVTASEIFDTIVNNNGVQAGALANNGGPVQTIALKAGLANPAIDAGATPPTEQALNIDVDGDGTIEATPISVDARGFARQVGASADIGAVEFSEAASLLVTTTQDVVSASDGLTSLREALALANNATAGNLGTGDADNDGQALDTIRFDPTVFGSGGVIRLDQALGTLTVSSAVKIDGSTAGGEVLITGDTGSNDSLVAGTNLTDVFTSDTNNTLSDNLRVLSFDANSDGSSIDRMTLTGGAASAGGGIYATQTDLAITNSTIFGNKAINSGGIAFTQSTFKISNTTVANNLATTFNGGSGGGLGQSGSSTGQIENSTFSGNQANLAGGGIANFSGQLTLSNTTVSGNSAGFGGGVASNGNIATTFTILQSTIIAGNTATSAVTAGNDLSTTSISSSVSTFLTGSNNLIGDGQFNGTTFFSPTNNNYDVVGTTANRVDPLLSPLADNGGPTQTMAPLAGSPAINAGANPRSLASDQRGTGFARENGGQADIGAVESEFSLIVTTASDVVNPTDGLTSLREAIALANATAGADTITFASGQGQAFQNGGLIRLTQGELIITDAVTINGAGKVTITGDRLDDDITVSGDITDVALTRASNAALSDGIDNDGDGLTDGLDTDGETLLDDNSRIFNITDSSAATALNGLTLTGGHTLNVSGKGGAVYSNANLSVTDSTIRGNATQGDNADGGGIFGRTTVSVINSTVSSNSTQGKFAEGGGIYSANTVSLINSTVSGNSTIGDYAAGGGVFGFGTISLTNSTVSGNSTQGTFAQGGGIGGTSAILLTNSLVLGNIAVNAAGDDQFLRNGSTPNYTGGNIVGGTLSQNGVAVPGSIAATDVFDTTVNNNGATAGALADNGGPVQTIALKASLTNPAIDAGATPPTEQALGVDVDGDGTIETTPISVDGRGFARSVDITGVANTSSPTDIGAFETQNTATKGPDILEGTAGNDTQDPGLGNDLVFGFGANDLIIFDDAGSDTGIGGPGNDGFIFRSSFDPTDKVDGGEGTNDQMGLQGDYSQGVTFGPQSMTNVEVLAVLSGSDTRFGAPGDRAVHLQPDPGRCQYRRGPGPALHLDQPAGVREYHPQRLGGSGRPDPDLWRARHRDHHGHPEQ